MIWELCRHHSLQLGFIRHSTGRPPTYTLPFSLTDLHVFILPRDPLLKNLLQPSLTSLSIELFNFQLHPSHLAGLVQVAPQLTNLSLAIPSLLPDLEPFFRRCHRLSHLQSGLPLILEAIPWIPNPLQKLTLDYKLDRANLEEVGNLLRQATLALSSLRVLVLSETKAMLLAKEGGAELVRECEARGIALRLLEEGGSA